MTLTLYTNPMSRGRIAHWMMEELGQPYEMVYLDFATTMKQPPYIDINPMGKVPTLVHDERVVTEYAAICAYVADAFPEAGLAPKDRSAYYRWLFFGSGPFEASIITKALGVTVPDERRGMVGFRDVPTTLDVIESWLKDHPYLAGDAFSAADIATGSQIGWGLQFGTVEARPVFQDYWERVSARPAYQKANATNNAAIAKMKEAANA